MPDPVGPAPAGSDYLVDASGAYLTDTDGDHLRVRGADEIRCGIYGTVVAPTIRSAVTLSIAGAGASTLTITSAGVGTVGSVVGPVEPEPVDDGQILAFSPEGTAFLDDEGNPISDDGTLVEASERILNNIRLGHVLTYDDEILP